MNKVAESSERVKCRFCAEMIMPEALICPFCRSRLSLAPQSEVSEKPISPPGLLGMIVQNFLCPGLPAWKMGHRTRGTLIFLVITGSISIYAAQVMPKIQEKIPMIVKAATSGRANDLASLTANIEQDIENNIWLDVAFYAYLASFVDSYFLMVNARKSGGDPEKK